MFENNVAGWPSTETSLVVLQRFRFLKVIGIRFRSLLRSSNELRTNCCNATGCVSVLGGSNTLLSNTFDSFRKLGFV